MTASMGCGSSGCLTFWLLLPLAGSLSCVAEPTGPTEQTMRSVFTAQNGIPVGYARINLKSPIAATTTAQQLNRSANNSACTPRSVETFPPDLFTLEQKRGGAVVLHILVTLWLFAALAIICENYFVASLETICESLHMKPDVAGATFMAAGVSSLGLLASLIGVFLAKSDVGVSTIVGSAIFNNLMISSICGLAATQVVYFSYWPLLRDCGFYCFSLVVYIVIISDELVYWYESVVLLALFVSYIVIIMFNDRIDSAISKRWPRLATGGVKRFRETERQLSNDMSHIMDAWSVEMHGRKYDTNGDTNTNEVDDATLVTVIDSRPESPFVAPEGLLKRAYWLFTLPWVAAFYVTIPDCRRPGIWRRLFLLTFLSSVVWIFSMIYVLVWMVCVTGDTIGIPDTVMGLTLLAIGICMPDAMSAVFVSRSGMSEMAIANSIASNVFDITLSLGLPWFISTTLLHPGSSVVINSVGLTYTSITLLSTVLFLLVAIHLNKMRMDRKLGVIFLTVYLSVITFACLYETNVFGPLNPPSCPRNRL